MCLLCRLGQGGGDGLFLALAVTVGGVGVGLHGQQVHDAMELALGADRQLYRHGGAPEVGLDALQCPLETGPLAIQLVDDYRARQLVAVAEAPHLLGLDLDARHSVHQDQRGIGRHQRRPSVVDEDVEPGSIEQVDLGLVPLGHAHCGRDGHLALDLVVVEIRDPASGGW